MKAEAGLLKPNPALRAAVVSLALTRSAVAFSRDSSVGENQVKTLQSYQLKMRG